MLRVRPMVVISIGFTIASSAMAAVAAELTATGSNASFMSLDRDGAVASAVIAAVCWLEVRRDRREEDKRRRDEDMRRMEAEYRRREAALLRTFSSLDGAPTGPLRQLHSA